VPKAAVCSGQKNDSWWFRNRTSALGFSLSFIKSHPTDKRLRQCRQAQQWRCRIVQKMHPQWGLYQRSPFDFTYVVKGFLTQLSEHQLHAILTDGLSVSAMQLQAMRAQTYTTSLKLFFSIFTTTGVGMCRWVKLRQTHAWRWLPSKTWHRVG